MASVTVNLTGYVSSAVSIQWPDDQPLGSIFDAGGQNQVFSRLQIQSNDVVRIDLAGSDDRFTSAFEATGRIIIEASDGETLEIQIANADMTEPYQWIPSNATEVSAFYNHVRGLTDQDATLTLTDDPPATDHTVDAGNVSWSFDVSEPTVTHTPAPTATAPSRPAQPTLVVDSDTQITATGVAPDDGGSPITSYDWRHRVRGSGGSGWVDRSNVTNLIQAFSGLDASTEYDFRFRATNDVGNSPYSFPIRATTDAPPPVTADHTVDAGNANWSFAVPQPTVTHTTPGVTDHTVNAGNASWSFDVPQPTVTHTTSGPQNHTVNAGNVSWSFHVPQPSVRHTTPFVLAPGISIPHIYTSRPTNVYTAGLGTPIVGNVYGVTIDEGKDSVRSQNPARPRTLSCQLTAPVGIYGSDTYQEGDLLECQIEDRDGQETWFKGILDKPRETSLQGDRTHVNLRAFGLTVLLADARPVTPVYESITVATAIGHLFDACGWPTAYRVIDSSGLSAPLTYWWCDGRQSGIAHLNRLLESIGPPAQWFEDRTGRAIVHGSAWVGNDSRRATSILTFRPQPVTDRDLSDVVNFATYQLETFNKEATAVVWESGEIIALPVGDTTVRAEPNGIVAEYTTPAPNTDFDLDTNSGVTVALANENATSVDIVFTATASRTLSNLQLRGRELKVVGRSVVTDSEGRGDIPWKGRGWPTLSRLAAQAVVLGVVGAYGEGISSRQLGLLVSNPAVYDDYKTMEPLAPVDVADPGGDYSARIRALRWEWVDTRLIARAIVDQDGGLIQGGLAGPFILGASMLGGGDYLWI